MQGSLLGVVFFLEFAAKDWRLAPRLGRQAIKCSLSGEKPKLPFGSCIGLGGFKAGWPLDFLPLPHGRLA